MKKIFTLAVILISATTISLAADVKPRPGNVFIRSNSDRFIQVVIDGRQYNMDRNDFTTDNIRPGRHCIEVYQLVNYGPFRKGTQKIYSTVTNVKPWESLNVNIDRAERVFVDSRPNRDDRNNGYGRNDGYDRNDRGAVYGDRDDHYRH